MENTAGKKWKVALKSPSSALKSDQVPCWHFVSLPHAFLEVHAFTPSSCSFSARWLLTERGREWLLCSLLKANVCLSACLGWKARELWVSSFWLAHSWQSLFTLQWKGESQLQTASFGDRSTFCISIHFVVGFGWGHSVFWKFFCTGSRDGLIKKDRKRTWIFKRSPLRRDCSHLQIATGASLPSSYPWCPPVWLSDCSGVSRHLAFVGAAC